MNRLSRSIAAGACVLCLALLLASCSSPPTKSLSKRAQLEYALGESGVIVDAVTEKGKGVEVRYEASGATDYDAQVVMDWATIMGAAAGMGYDPIMIVNTVNGQPYATLTTSAANVNDYLASKKNETAFWQDVDITAAS